eukprot:TRINITY_DN2370_c0_g1_i1.p1 TRINITY_DN2370_c0_g1~~TRINITY_DN2370_c0_g1_i1.p1  ORF type:complete len:573 (+),score=140.44 TRINITY_DN2370_c0_g1_i1:132-1850(+)
MSGAMNELLALVPHASVADVERALEAAKGNVNDAADWLLGTCTHSDIAGAVSPTSAAAASIPSGNALLPPAVPSDSSKHPQTNQSQRGAIDQLLWLFPHLTVTDVERELGTSGNVNDIANRLLATASRSDAAGTPPSGPMTPQFTVTSPPAPWPPSPCASLSTATPTTASHSPAAPSTPPFVLSNPASPQLNTIVAASPTAVPVTPRGSPPASPTACRQFRIVELETATNGFHESKKIGCGGFGAVFVGRLEDCSTEVAIKRLDQPALLGEHYGLPSQEQFLAEIRTLSKYQHPNIVQLIGFSDDDSQRQCLVYAFMPNGSLEDVLQKHLLNWRQRVHIAADAARGLAYLHSVRITHRDVKTANILLDEHLNARVGDVGLARAGPQAPGAACQTQHTAQLVGTYQYLAPEAMRGRWSPSMDVYSFGVCLLEIIRGQPVQWKGRSEPDIVSYGDALYGQPDPLAAFAGASDCQWPPDVLGLMVELAMCCLKKKDQRPPMKEVAHRLSECVSQSTSATSPEPPVPLCRRCGLSPSAVLVLPCQHLAACVPCAAALLQCPLCSLCVTSTVTVVVA